MKNSEDSRGNALQRTLHILRDLMRGKVHDRHTAAVLVGIQPAAADRRLSAMEATIPGVVSRVVDNRRREYRFDAASMLNIKRPTKQAVVAACFGASLGNLFEGSYRAAMQEPLGHMVKRRRAKFREVDRKFWFVRRGGEGSLPGKEDLLHELIDALLEQNVTEIEYEHFEGKVDKSRIRPLSVVIHDHQLYFIAQNEAGSMRFYRFARIVKAERLDETFTYPGRITYDPDRMLRDSFGIFIGETYPVTDVRVRLSARWAAFARSHRWHPSQQSPPESATDEEARAVELRFHLRVCPEFENWILGLGEDVEVLEPESLRVRIAERIRRAASVYDKKTDT
jgi:predicted DNA-binding transcriptional regulator YafY